MLSGRPGKQAKYIEADSNNASVDPAVLRLLRRKYILFAPRPIKEPTVFYGVRLGHVPGVYTSWKEAKPHTVGLQALQNSTEGRRVRDSSNHAGPTLATLP